MSAGFCQKPDVDVPKVTCGYPLPCLRHVSAIIYPASGTVAVASDASPVLRERLADIGAAINGRARRKKANRR